ncbi:hypothetical protein Cni_G24407 [Canna indica]|uniref:Uncharacterized protein n=1 Tax=Canna indica TaxID=4628 RepID=A0AAQ3L035_9LILI|nr:hypothetical protein Cni_G24407 [Canna indica]
MIPGSGAPCRWSEARCCCSSSLKDLLAPATAGRPSRPVCFFRPTLVVLSAGGSLRPPAGRGEVDRALLHLSQRIAPNFRVLHDRPGHPPWIPRRRRRARRVYVREVSDGAEGYPRSPSAVYRPAAGVHRRTACRQARGDPVAPRYRGLETGQESPASRSYAAARSAKAMPPLEPAPEEAAAEVEEVPTSGICRPLSDILKELGKKVPESLIKTRVEEGVAIRYIPWFASFCRLSFCLVLLHVPTFLGKIVLRARNCPKSHIVVEVENEKLAHLQALTSGSDQVSTGGPGCNLIGSMSTQMVPTMKQLTLNGPIPVISQLDPQYFSPHPSLPSTQDFASLDIETAGTLPSSPKIITYHRRQSRSGGKPSSSLKGCLLRRSSRLSAHGARGDCLKRAPDLKARLFEGHHCGSSTMGANQTATLKALGLHSTRMVTDLSNLSIVEQASAIGFVNLTSPFQLEEKLKNVVAGKA